MKLNVADFGRKWQFPVMMAAGSLPIPIIVCVQNAPEFQNVSLVLAGMYIVLTWMSTVVPGKLRLLAGLLFSAAITAASIALLPMAESRAMWLIPVLYVGMLMGGLRMGGFSRGQELHPVVGAVCLLTHLLGQFMVNTDKLNRAEPIYRQAAPVLILSFICFAAMALLAMNRVSLNSAVNGLQAVPTAMRHKNLLLTFGFLAVTLLVASLPAIARLIEEAWKLLMKVIKAIVAFLLSLLPESQLGGGGGGGGMEMFAAEPVEQSLLSMILEKALLVFGILLAAVLMFFLLRVAWKKLKVLLKILWARLNAYMVSSSEDYVDEISDTREGGVTESFLRRRRKRLLRRRVDESTLNPQQRVRYRYLMLWERHPEWTSDRTARENLSEDTAQIYERARYSSHEITERDVNEFASKLK